MNKARTVVLGCAVLIFFSTLQAQVTMSVSHIPLDQLTIGDLDFQTGGSRSLFFTVSIQSTPPQNTVMRVSASVRLPDVTYSNAISFRTHPFEIPRTFTNLDLGPGSFIRINGTVDFSEEAKTRLQNEALTTGRLPAGTYTFNLELYDETGQNLLTPARSFTFTIRNISRLDLISPADNETVPNAFPLFQWIFDGTRVEVSVYERLPQHQSKEEATQGTPHLVRELTGVRLFQFPTDASRPLEPGKTYVWKVRGFTAGTGGVGSTINSELWQFLVSTGGPPGYSFRGGGGGVGGAGQSFINQLQLIPGLSPQLLNQLASGNLQLTGLLYVNGSPVSPAQIMAILNDLAQNPDKIIEVQLIDRR